jgi:predicted O-methyltransferase YrrM
MNDLCNLHEPAAMATLSEASRKAGFTMASEPLTGSLLRTLAATKAGGRFLELGSGTGLSTAWILDGMDAKATLTTVDSDERWLQSCGFVLAMTSGCA